MTRDEWLKERRNGIGASDAATIMGLSPWRSNVQLWEEKTGRREQPDISDKPYIQYGIEAEPHLRELYALDHPEYEVTYYEFDVIRNPQHSFIFATLDGRLTEKSTGRKGVYEGKTTEIRKASEWEKWETRLPNGKWVKRLPDVYYIQVLHQLLATGWEFAELNVQIKYLDKFKDHAFTKRSNHIERRDVIEDIQILLHKELEFWNMVTLDKKPDLLLPQI